LIWYHHVPYRISAHTIISAFRLCSLHSSFFFLNDTAPPEIYTLSLHDALPISLLAINEQRIWASPLSRLLTVVLLVLLWGLTLRSEEHTSELQSRENLVCRLLLEKKKKHAQKRELGMSH